jgi:hypothetical protein
MPRFIKLVNSLDIAYLYFIKYKCLSIALYPFNNLSTLSLHNCFFGKVKYAKLKAI